MNNEPSPSILVGHTQYILLVSCEFELSHQLFRINDNKQFWNTFPSEDAWAQDDNYLDYVTLMEAPWDSYILPSKSNLSILTIVTI